MYPPSETSVNRWTQSHNIGLLLIIIAMIVLGLLPLPSLRVGVWLAVLGLLTLFGVVVGHGITGSWYGLLIDQHHKLLLSRLQMILWTLVILSGFLAAGFANVSSGQDEPLRIDVPPELWLLMGISTASLVSAPLLNGKSVTSSGNGGGGGPIPLSAAPEVQRELRWSDLFQIEHGDGRGRLDLSKLQMFFFTLILVIAYGAALAGLFAQQEAKIEALPALDPGMMLLLGISHVGFLVDKALPTNGHKSQTITS